MIHPWHEVTPAAEGLELPRGFRSVIVKKKAGGGHDHDHDDEY